MSASSFKHWVNLLLKTTYRKRHFALRKLEGLPRYISTSTDLLGTEIRLVDAASFLFMYNEIFEQQIYKFKSETQQPRIIDGGANIGLSSLYFKQLYPHSHIIAFEPDVNVFSVLEHNIHAFGYSDVVLLNKAIWNSETTLDFMSEGADGGRLVEFESSRKISQVPTARLRDFLTEKVDLLKLDIEGSETEVIQDCQDLLGNVENLFVEYHSFINRRQTLHIILNTLSNSGFRVHIHPPVTSPQPFYHRYVSFGMDMQLNIFAFRE